MLHCDARICWRVCVKHARSWQLSKAQQVNRKMLAQRGRPGFAFHDEERITCDVVTDKLVFEQLHALQANQICSLYKEAFQFKAAKTLKMQTVGGHHCKINGITWRQLVRDLNICHPYEKIRPHRSDACADELVEIRSKANSRELWYRTRYWNQASWLGVRCLPCWNGCATIGIVITKSIFRAATIVTSRGARYDCRAVKTCRLRRVCDSCGCCYMCLIRWRANGLSLRSHLYKLPHFEIVRVHRAHQMLHHIFRKV